MPCASFQTRRARPTRGDEPILLRQDGICQKRCRFIFTYSAPCVIVEAFAHAARSSGPDDMSFTPLAWHYTIMPFHAPVDFIHRIRYLAPRLLTAMLNTVGAVDSLRRRDALLAASDVDITSFPRFSSFSLSCCRTVEAGAENSIP